MSIWAKSAELVWKSHFLSEKYRKLKLQAAIMAKISFFFSPLSLFCKIDLNSKVSN